MLNQLNAIHLPLDLRYRNSTDAMSALSRGECDLAGFHVPFGKFEEATVALYARWLNKKTQCLIHLAVRNQGLMVAPGNPKNIHTLSDLAENCVFFVNRQTGSGTRMLLEMLLDKAGVAQHSVKGFENTEFTHSAVAAFIASGMADVGFGVQTAAERFGLEFIPLIRERYFFALSIKVMQDPLIKQIISIIKTDAFRQVVNQLAGYEGKATGEIVSLSDAFASLGENPFE